MDPTRVPPAVAARMVAARARLAWAFTWLPGAVVLACAGMVALAALDGFAWWQVLPVIGALVPFLACQAANPPPPRWPHTAFLTAAGQLLLGAIPAYGVAAATAAGPALPLFLIAWIGLIASIPLARGALKALMSPLTPDLGATPLTLRFGVRTAIERADTITTGVTLGLTHLVAHARRHAAYSRGNPTEIAVPLGEILGVRPVVLPAMLPWLSLSDGTRLLATAGPAVELRTRSGEFLIPTDDAALLTELIARRCAFAGQTR